MALDSQGSCEGSGQQQSGSSAKPIIGPILAVSNILSLLSRLRTCSQSVIFHSAPKNPTDA
jgi:hypothetical protein